MKLHAYQQRAVEHLHENPRAGLFLDMGLGKTATVLSALTPQHLPVLVSAPKRVAEQVWTEEVQKWRPDLTITVASGSPAKKAEALKADTDIVVIGHDNLKYVPNKHQFRTVVLDELSSYKSRQSQRWRFARRITKDVQFIWGLTGTPAPNGLLDLWPQVFLLDKGERLGKGITGYRARYFAEAGRLPNGIVTGYNLRPGAEKAIHRKIDDICLSMQAKDLLDLPPITHNEIQVPLPDKVMRLYKKMKDDLVMNLDVLGAPPATAATAAALSSKLSQISAGFVYADDYDLTGDYTWLHWEKINALKEILDGTGSPVLVFYRYLSEKTNILLNVEGVRTIDEPDVIQDWNRGKVPVLLAHPASAGHGLNLQHGGHTMVWTSLPWSLEHYQQSLGRLHRQNQTNPVVVHYLLSPKTIDGLILKRLRDKTTVQQTLLDHLDHKKVDHANHS